MLFLVTVTRVTVYRVEADDEEQAEGRFTDADEIDQSTLSMNVELDEGQYDDD